MVLVIEAQQVESLDFSRLWGSDRDPGAVLGVLPSALVLADVVQEGVRVFVEEEPGFVFGEFFEVVKGGQMETGYDVFRLEKLKTLINNLREGLHLNHHSLHKL